MSGKTSVSDLEKLEKAAGEFLEATKQIGPHHRLSTLDADERLKVNGLFREVMGETRRIIEALHVFCSFCRNAGDILGACAQCGEEVCSSCGVEIEGKVVHKDICARFFPGDGGSSE